MCNKRKQQLASKQICYSYCLQFHLRQLFIFVRMNPQSAKYIIIAGIALAIIGIVIYFFYDKLTWLGRLPGDIRIERENFKFYFPITTMILLSLVLTVLVNVIRRL